MQILVRTSTYVIILTDRSMHGYIIGNTAFCNMLVMCHMKFTAIHRFYTNIISYMHAHNFTLIYAIHNLCYVIIMLVYRRLLAAICLHDKAAV